MSTKYYHSESSVKEYIRLAQDVNSNSLIEKLGVYLKENDSVLELGSGPGIDWEILSRLYDVVGSDFSPVFLNRLTKKYPKHQFLELDAITLVTDLKFDAIYSNKVLHHLTDRELETSIENQHAIVNDGGWVFHSFWKGKGNEMFKDMFVNYHDKTDLKKLFSKLFTVVSIIEYTEFEKNDSLFIIAQKQ